VRTVGETKDTYRQTPTNVVDGTLTTTYAYDSYGNQITQTQTGGGVTLITHTEYSPNTSGGKWLVGLPARTWTESDGVTLTESLNLYDGANDYATQPTTGILTATRSWMSGNLETGNYSQTSITYDDWGNVTSQTAWTGYGTRNSAPTTGARTSTTCYGGSDGAGEYLGGKWCPNDGYHTYALWTKNPLGHESTVTYDYAKGVPLSETDPNGAVTSATYDVFGRFTSLARPSASGPSETSPSLNVSYQNSPFKVTLTQAIDTGLTFTVVRNYDGMGRQTSTVTNGVTTLYQYGYEYGPLTPRVDKVSMPGSTSDFTTTKYDALGRPDLVTAPDGTQTDYIYNGLETKVKDANLHETITVTDILGRTLSVTPPTGPAVSFTYDPLGNLLTATRGGATMILTYDKAGRKLTMADPDMGN
jgi:YD repeat-containing protein